MYLNLLVPIPSPPRRAASPRAQVLPMGLRSALALAFLLTSCGVDGQSYGARLAALSHGGEPCNVTSNESDTSDHIHRPPAHLYAAGVTVSVVADLIIAASMGIQKHAHNRNIGPDGRTPMKPYTRLPLWWMGCCLNLCGEAANMLAFGMAPAAVVAPVGSVGVIANELIAVTFLKEPLRKRDLSGLVGVVVGVVLVIASVPESAERLNVHELLSTHIFLAPRTYWYLIGLLLAVRCRRSNRRPCQP